MVAGGPGASSLARDTIFAATMITCNGIVGLTLLFGSTRDTVAVFNPEGSGAALASVATLATLTLVLPGFTSTAPGPVYATSQLVFAALASLVIYGLFVVTQTIRHRDFFLPVHTSETVDESHANPPSNRATWISLGLLMVALIGVVGLAKVESYAIELAIRFLGFPEAFLGVVIALLVLLPEALAASNAARRKRVQVGLNLAYGSAMASIGLTIPVIVVAMIWLEGPLVLGLGGTQIVLLGITLVVGTLTVVTGRATRLQAALHLALMAAFVFLAAVP